MRVLFFGTFDDRRHPRARVLAEGFVEHGDEVFACNEPLPVDTAARVEALRKPWRLLGLGLRVLRAWVRLARRARALPPPDVVVVGYLGHLDVLLARLLFRRTPIVLDHLVSLADTARDRDVGSGWLVRALGWLDGRALRAADVVVVDTVEHRDALPAWARVRAVVVPVGAPQAWFVSGGVAASGPLRVLFFGLFTPLQGAPVIGEAIGLLAGEPIAFTMVGAGQDLAAARAAAAGNPAVEWIEWAEPEELPAIAAAHDVCLGILGTGPKARRVVPNKVYQGAAAGCAIVTSDTPPQRRAFEDAAVFVPPGDARALAEVLRALAAERERLAALRKAAAHRAEEAFTPAAAVDALRARLREPAPARPAADPPLTPNAWLRHDVVMRALDRLGPEARALLEVGAGQGAMAVRLARRFTYTGVEPDPASCATARARIEATGLGEVVQGEASALPVERRFDVVCAFEVLEHIADDAGALRAWRARLRPGGTLVLSVPAYQHRFGAADRAVGHHRRYDPDALRALLREAGFDRVEVRAYGFPLGFVLEPVRNRLAARAAAPSTPEEGSAVSGRWHQPPARLGGLIRAGTVPFRLLQRPFERSRLATGWVVVARRAD